MGCGGKDSGGGPAADGGATADGSTPPVDGGADPGSDAGPLPAPGPLRAERWGARLHGRVVDLSRHGRSLWIGSAAAVDPADATRVRSQLVRLDLDTGVVDVWEEELPKRPADESPWASDGPVATAGVIEDGDRVLVVARSGLLVLEDDGTFTEHLLTVEGVGDATPVHAVLDRDGGRARLWVSTNLGLLRLDPDTLAIEERLGSDVLATDQMGALAVDPATGAIYVAGYFETLEGGETSGVLKIVDGALDNAFVPGELGAPRGRVGDVVWSADHGAAFIALASWDPASGGVVRWDGAELVHVADERALSTASLGEERAFGASVLALDLADDLLIVGGRKQATGPASSPIGGGLAWIDLSTLDTELAVAGVSTFTSDIAGEHVDALAYDPQTNRTYAALQQPCSELRLGNAGLVAIHFEDSRPVFEMPVLSGVRDVAVLGSDAYAAIRDDLPGLRCDGVNVQGGFVRLSSDRSGSYVPLTGSGAYGDASLYKTTRLAFDALDLRDADSFLVSGWRNSVFAGPPGDGTLIAAPIEIGVSLYAYDVAWERENVFWVAGRAHHDPADPPFAADAGPRGAARVVLATDGSIESYTHYVRALRDPDPNAVEGLPSSEVRAVVVADEGVYLLSATERMWGGGYDRDEGDVFVLDGERRLGGLSLVAADGSLTVLAGGDQIPDGRAASLDAEGTLWILDAQRGLLRLDGDAVVAATLPLEVPEGSIPRSLWLGEGGDMVASFSTGAIVRLDRRTEWIDGVGHVWNAARRADGVLLLGTDQGLLRVVAEGATDPAEATPVLGGLPRFHVYDAPGTGGGGGGGGGECLAERQVCGGVDPTPCCPGLTCAGFGFVQECVPG